MHLRVVVAIPVFNHLKTLRAIVEGALLVHPVVVVVDDGSTEGEASQVLHGLPVRCLRHESNLGKGAALRTAEEQARALGGTHLLTLDADGQHDPAEIPLLLEETRQDPGAIVIGARQVISGQAPFPSRFGRAFSNFWFRLLTGLAVGDTQSGFRVYPLELLGARRSKEARYAFESEILVRAAWAAVPIREVPVKSAYPPGQAHVTHFRRVADSGRFLALHMRLTLRALLPLPQPQGAERFSLRHPVRSLKRVFAKGATPSELAASSALGVFLGTLPLVGCHSLAILLAASYLRRGKLAALAASQLCAPPFVPALCVEAGHYLIHGALLTEVSLETLGVQFLSRLWEYLLGSLLLAPLLAAVAWGGTYLAALAVAGVAATKRGAGPPQKAAWEGQSFGGPLRRAFAYGVVRFGGRVVAKLLLRPVALYYALAHPQVRRRTYPYLCRRFPEDGSWRRFRRSYRIFLAFGEVLVDQAALGAGGGQDDVAFPSSAEFFALLGEGKGLILLLGHVGGWQAVLPSLANAGTAVHLVMRREPSETNLLYFERGGETPPFQIIQPEGELGGSLEMLAALTRREILCLMGDRTWGSDRNSLTRPFLGVPAPFPISAYRLASATGAPIAVLLPRKGDAGSYEIRLDRILRVPERLGRTPEAYAPYLDQYLLALEGFVAEHPYEFFNFHDLWQDAVGARDEGRATAEPSPLPETVSHG